MVAYLAYKQCNYQTDPECLKKALFSIKNYHGLAGTKSFDDVYGDMTDSYYLGVADAKSKSFLPYTE